jgi:hypothetical protein
VQQAAPKDMTRPAPPSNRGLVLDLGTGVRYTGGSIARDMSVAGGFVGLDLGLGVYVTQHLAVVTGGRASTGAIVRGCAGKCDSAYALQVPALVQVAFVNRHQGFYAEAGATFLNMMGGSSKDPKASETLMLSAPVMGTAAIGYRVPRRDQSGNATGGGVYFRLGADVGQFSTLRYASAAGSVDGDIDPSARAWHWNGQFAAGWAFMP